MTDHDSHEAAASEELERIAERQAQTEQAIGRFIYEFSQLEVALKSLIMRTIELDGRFFNAIFGSIDVAQCCNILAAVTRIKFEGRTDWIKSTNDLINQTKALNQKRVVIAHATWEWSAEGLAARSVSRQKLVEAYHYERRQELVEDAEQARYLNAAFDFSPGSPEEILNSELTPGIPPD